MQSQKGNGLKTYFIFLFLVLASFTNCRENLLNEKTNNFNFGNVVFSYFSGELFQDGRKVETAIMDASKDIYISIVDATSKTDYIYFNFLNEHKKATQGSGIKNIDPKVDHWHFSHKRFEIILNGGVNFKTAVPLDPGVDKKKYWIYGTIKPNQFLLFDNMETVPDLTADEWKTDTSNRTEFFGYVYPDRLFGTWYDYSLDSHGVITPKNQLFILKIPEMDKADSFRYVLIEIISFYHPTNGEERGYLTFRWKFLTKSN